MVNRLNVLTALTVVLLFATLPLCLLQFPYMFKAVEAPLAGHPDKICDRLVESIVDEYIRRDPFAKLDVQALGTNGMVMIGGMIESAADFAVIDIVRRSYADLGYTDMPEFFVNGEKPKPEPGRSKQSGAQGTAIVYGYATNQTRELLPPSVVFANALARQIDMLRMQDQRFSWLRPDGKVQLVMDGDRIVQVTVIAAHDPQMDMPHVQSLLLEHAIKPILGTIEQAQIFINPVGSFTTGGFLLNAGVSGRKVLSDLYGGLIPHGGVALVGKDPLKPARSGTYMARFVARQLVKEGLAQHVLVQAVYTVGVAEPVVLQAMSNDGEDLTSIVKQRFDFRPEAIVERFNLRRPIYEHCVHYGMFGRKDVPWEE